MAFFNHKASAQNNTECIGFILLKARLKKLLDAMKLSCKRPNERASTVGGRRRGKSSVIEKSVTENLLYYY